MQNTTENPSIGENLHQFKTGIDNPNLTNYRATLEAGINLLRESTKDHSYPVLQGIFTNYKDYNDLISKIETYFVTNGSFKYYRYSKFDKDYSENFDLDFSKHDIRSLLILIRCYNISQGDISKPVQKLIEAYQYIDASKANKSLEEVKKELPGISHKYIENRYKDKDYTISKVGELAKMINANLYLLSYDHKAFTQSIKDGRRFNAFTSLNRVYRENELAFQLGEFDISSANPQIIDAVFDFNNWRNVYSNLMKSYKISRDQAKVKFNSTINNYKLSFDQANAVYLNSGYSESESAQLANYTAQSKKGNVYRLMARKESEIMETFINTNFKNIPCIRLHDAVYYEPEFHELTNVQYNGVSFGHSAISKEHLRLNLKLNTFKTVLTTPPESGKGVIWKRYFDKDQAKKIYFGENFTFYNKDFQVLSATFNINKPIIKDREYRTPSESEFLQRLKRLYITLYYLNEDEGIFYKCIEHIHDQEGIDFNKNYIYGYFKSYTFEMDDVQLFIKKRDWKYTGSGVIDNVKIFNEIFHKERRECINTIDRPKLVEDLQRFKDRLENNQLYYIDRERYYYHKKYESGTIIKQIYDVVGISRIDGIKAFNESVSLKDQPILKSNNIASTISDTPIRKLMREANLSQSMATKIKAILSNKSDIIMKLENAIQNLKANRTKNIFESQESQKVNGVPTISPLEAFDNPIQYEGGVFDVPRESAINMSKQFFKEWAQHQTLKLIFEGAKGGITQNYDNHKWRKQILASQIYDDYNNELANVG